MRRIHFGNEQRNIGIHAVIARIADDGIAGTSEILFGGTGDGGIEGGENEVAVERGIETFHDEIASFCWDGHVEMPANGFGVGLAGRTLGGGNFGEVEPRMIAEHLNEPLADDAGGAEDSCFPFLVRAFGLHVLISVDLRWGTHAAPPSRDEIEKLELESCEVVRESRSERGEPMRVPRAWGLKVLRTQTIILVSAARGRTFSWRTFAPLAARA